MRRGAVAASTKGDPGAVIRARWIRTTSLAIAPALLGACAWHWGDLEASFDAAAPHDAPADSPPPFDAITDAARDGGPEADATDALPLDAPDVVAPDDAPDVTTPDAGDGGATDAGVDAVDVPELQCAAGTDRAGPGQPCLPVVPPRLFAPLSNAVVTRANPTLRAYVRDPGPGEIRPARLLVEICDEPSCAVVQSLTADVPAAGNVVPVQLPPTLSPGWHAWRASALTPGGATAPTPRWTFWVPAGPGTGADSFTGFSPRDVTPGATGDGFDDTLIIANATGGSLGFVYRGAASGGPAAGYSLLPPAGSTSSYGSALAVVGPVLSGGAANTAVVVGDPGASGTYLYLLANAPSGQPVSAGVSSSHASATEFGTAIAALGDADGGGYADFAVGQPGNDTVFVYAGETYVDGLTALATIRCGAACSGQGVGATVANAGDVDGDGRPELLVGRRASDTVLVYAFDGGTRAYVLVATIDPPGTALKAMAGVGDVNADGYADVAIATDNGLSVYLGGASGLTTTPDRTVVMPGISAVAALGDTDGDGWADFAVSNQNAGLHAINWFYAISGPYESPASVAWPTFQIFEMDATSSLGEHLAGAGDVNGDGLGDMVASDPLNNQAVFFLGQTAGPPMRVNLPSPSPTLITGFGTQVACLVPTRPRAHARTAAQRAL